MPINVSNMKNDRRAVEFEYAGDMVHLIYKPSEMTPTVMAELREKNNEGDNYFTVDLLQKILVTWDVQLEDGSEMPITFENMKDLPSAFLAACLRECTEDMLVKKKKGQR